MVPRRFICMDSKSQKGVKLSSLCLGMFSWCFIHSKHQKTTLKYDLFKTVSDHSPLFSLPSVTLASLVSFVAFESSLLCQKCGYPGFWCAQNVMSSHRSLLTSLTKLCLLPSFFPPIILDHTMVLFSHNTSLVCQHCHNKYHRRGGIKQQKWIFSQFWELRSLRSHFLWDPSLCLIHGHFIVFSPYVYSYPNFLF